jgi:hypothetical protein
VARTEPARIGSRARPDSGHVRIRDTFAEPAGQNPNKDSREIVVTSTRAVVEVTFTPGGR